MQAGAGRANTPPPVYGDDASIHNGFQPRLAITIIPSYPGKYKTEGAGGKIDFVLYLSAARVYG